MAEEKAAAAVAPAPVGGGGGQKPIILIIVAVLNMIFMGAAGFMFLKAREAEQKRPSLDAVVAGEKKAQDEHGGGAHGEGHGEENAVGRVVPLETFMVNLAGSKGRKIAKINMEIEIKDNDAHKGSVADEIDKRKAQVRDIIIIILSSKTYEEVATREGKDSLRNEIKDTINSFLTNGKITNVFFTEFIYN